MLRVVAFDPPPSNKKATNTKEGDILSLGRTLLQALIGQTSVQSFAVGDLLEPAQLSLVPRILTRQVCGERDFDDGITLCELMGMKWLRNIAFQRVRSETDISMSRDDVLRLARGVVISAWNGDESGSCIGEGVGVGVGMWSNDVGFDTDEVEGSSTVEVESEYGMGMAMCRGARGDADEEWTRWITSEFCRVDVEFDPDVDGEFGMAMRMRTQMLHGAP